MKTKRLGLEDYEIKYLDWLKNKKERKNKWEDPRFEEHTYAKMSC